MVDAMTNKPTLAIKWQTVDVIAEHKGINTPDKLAAAMGIHRSTLSRVRSGNSLPGNEFIAALCDALELNPNEAVVVDNAKPTRRQAAA